jgi:hypothetical protein
MGFAVLGRVRLFFPFYIFRLPTKDNPIPRTERRMKKSLRQASVDVGGGTPTSMQPIRHPLLVHRSPFLPLPDLSVKSRSSQSALLFMFTKRGQEYPEACLE